MNDQPLQPIAPAVEPIQFVSMLVVIAILIFLILQFRQDSSRWRWSVPIGIWTAHGFIFYLVLFANRAGWIPFDVAYTTWSSILRLHGYITILTVEVARWYLRSSRGIKT